MVTKMPMKSTNVQHLGFHCVNEEQTETGEDKVPKSREMATENGRWPRLRNLEIARFIYLPLCM